MFEVTSAKTTKTLVVIVTTTVRGAGDLPCVVLGAEGDTTRVLLHWGTIVKEDGKSPILVCVAFKEHTDSAHCGRTGFIS